MSERDEPEVPDPPPAGEVPAPEGGDQPVARRVEPGDWEIVLAEADPQPLQPATGHAGAPGPVNWALWSRALVPVVILLVYAVYKFSGRERPAAPIPEIQHAASISGVRPEGSAVRLDRQTRDFVARLERLRESDDWSAIRQAIATAEPAELRANPVVEAFDLLARVELEDAPGVLTPRVRALKTTFRTDRERRGLYEALLLAEARIYLKVTDSPESCTRNADRFRTALLEQSTNTAQVVDLRVRLAERYAAVARKQVEEAGRFRVDRVQLAEARSLYQHALRWVTTQDGWLQLQPISAGKASVVVNRLTVELQDANRRFHGRTLPFTKSDPNTWTGLAGDPIHDAPGGRW
ncbi:MAG: hypothetical protein KF858_04305 [Candidatus Sumerlaeia bacterium]|nr:hypothetical protein [Candidatus Sumerlaeia bacterium]